MLTSVAVQWAKLIALAQCRAICRPLKTFRAMMHSDFIMSGYINLLNSPHILPGNIFFNNITKEQSKHKKCKSLNYCNCLKVQP